MIAKRRMTLLLLSGALLVSPVLGSPISEVFKSVRDSVVVLETSERAMGGRRGQRELVQVGNLGSGVLIDERGHILTAAHVVQTAEEIRVHFADGTERSGSVWASAPEADLAVVKLDEAPVGAIVARLGDSDRTEVGDEVFIVGAPLGISYTLTVGHISARRRINELWGGFSRAEMFQTDAAIHHGNSGGPMFNLQGEVIGIVSSVISQSGGYEGLGFVVTSNMARQLVLEGHAVWTGIEGYLLEGPMAAILNLPQPLGMLIQRVAAGSPAARLGLRGGTIPMWIDGEEILIGGDVILAVEGITAEDEESFGRIVELVRSLEPGQEISVTVLRDGQTTGLKGSFLEGEVPQR
ncbi:MAG: trypsin-like peptidase domain-containing protein [Acidobacteriota bacterium]